MHLPVFPVLAATVLLSLSPASAQDNHLAVVAGETDRVAPPADPAPAAEAPSVTPATPAPAAEATPTTPATPATAAEAPAATPATVPALGPEDEARFLPQLLPASVPPAAVAAPESAPTAPESVDPPHPAPAAPDSPATDPGPAPDPATGAPPAPSPESLPSAPASTTAAPGSPADAPNSAAAPPAPVQAAAPEVAEAREASVTLADGAVLPYQIRTGTVKLLAEDGTTVRGEVFYTEYRRLAAAGAPPPPPAQRPLLFSFNGGPGSASVWLHLGAFGPRVVDFPTDGLTSPRPPVQLIDNPDTLLDAADLVFVDPIGTGFSRAQGETAAEEFYNLNADLESCSEFISRYLSHERRWSSPVFLAGESYGAMRVAGLAPRLQQRGVPLRGLALISGLLDFATLQDELLSSVCFLPTLATTAAYHRQQLAENPQAYGPQATELAARLAAPPATDLANSENSADPDPADPHANRRAELAAIHQAAADFARRELAPALLSSSAASPATEQIATAVGQLTGLRPEMIAAARLQIQPTLFRDQLLPGLNLGRFDARVIGPDTTPLHSFAQDDPSLSRVLPAFTNAANALFRDSLELQRPLDYTVLGGVNWSWDQFQNHYASVAPALDEALVTDAHLQVFVAMGYYDLATPPEGIRHSLRQLPHGQNRWQEHWYEGGHMMYLNRPERTRLNADLRGFLSR